jgi:maleylpyruvate isomerase
MRCREVWVHAIDLDVGASFVELPRGFVAAFVDEVVAGFTNRPECSGVELVDLEAGHHWSIGPRSADEVVVEGAAHDLLAWLLGRDNGRALRASTPALPTLPAWL